MMYKGSKIAFPITSKGDSAFIRFSAHADGTDFTEERSEGQNYIGFATGQTAPMDKSQYDWGLFDAGDIEATLDAILVIQNELIGGDSV